MSQVQTIEAKASGVQAGQAVEAAGTVSTQPYIAFTRDGEKVVAFYISVVTPFNRNSCRWPFLGIPPASTSVYLTSAMWFGPRVNSASMPGTRKVTLTPLLWKFAGRFR
jgi:hypothetical protein